MHPTSVGALSASSFRHPLAQIRSILDDCAGKNATPTQRLVLLAIAAHMDSCGKAWPSQATIMQKTGLSERAVRDALPGLRSLGLLNVEAEPTPRKSTVYRVTLTEQPHSGSENLSGRQLVPVKFPGNNQEEIKKRAEAHTRDEPDRGAGTSKPSKPELVNNVPAPGSSSCRSDPGAGTPTHDDAPALHTRAERSAANKAAWATRPRVLAPPARVRPQEPYKPYQLPLPSGTLLRDMDADTRAAMFREARRVVFGRSM